MRRVLAGVKAEFRIALRNRWVAIAIVMMAVFSLVLAAAGSAPTGTTGVDKLTVTVASLTSLGVYLVPLLALLMSFDAIAGEVERGTLPLALTYPVSRLEILLGKFIAQLGILVVALAAGYASAVAVAFWQDPEAVDGIAAMLRLFGSSILLGATFVAIGYAISAVARRPSAAAGLAIGLWLLIVILYDLGLLAAVVVDQGGAFTTEVFPFALLANPADAFRLFNLGSSGAAAMASGVGGAAGSIPPAQALVVITVWPILAFGLALLALRRLRP
jgi:Cu-processing system permease protein